MDDRISSTSGDGVSGGAAIGSAAELVAERNRVIPCEKIEISDCIPYCVQEYIYDQGWHASLTTSIVTLVQHILFLQIEFDFIRELLDIFYFLKE